MAGLPAGLQSLTLDLRQTSLGTAGVAGNDGLRALAAGLPPRLHALSLSFEGCGLGKEDARAVTASVLLSLEKFCQLQQSSQEFKHIFADIYREMKRPKRPGTSLMVHLGNRSVIILWISKKC